MTPSQRVKKEVQEKITEKVITEELHQASIPEALSSILKSVALRNASKLSGLAKPDSEKYEKERSLAVMEIERALARRMVAELKASYNI